MYNLQIMTSKYSVIHYLFCLGVLCYFVILLYHLITFKYLFYNSYTTLVYYVLVYFDFTFDLVPCFSICFDQFVFLLLLCVFLLLKK